MGNSTRLLSRGLVLVALVMEVPAPRAGAAEGAGKNALEQATKMYDAFFRGDDETFGDYTHPKVLELIGGRAKFLAVMKKFREDMRGLGWVIEKAPVSAPEQVVAADHGRVQAVLPTELVFRTPRGRVHQPSFLLGFSSDAGKTWKFIDTGRIGPDAIRKYFPECSPKLKIPTQPKSYESPD